MDKPSKQNQSRIQQENQLLASLLTTPNPDDIFTVGKTKSGKTYAFLNGKKADPVVLRKLKSEVEILRSLQLWTVLSDTLIAQARLLMFENAQSFDDMRGGKYMLHTLKVQKNILDSIEKAVDS